MSSGSKTKMEGPLRAQFLSATCGRDTMNFAEFMEVTGCRSRLYAQRLFDCIDTDNSGDISFEEFLHTIHILQTRDPGCRIQFIFQLYDLDNNGAISREELRQVLAASVEEGAAGIPTNDTEELTGTLLDLFDRNKDGVICFEEFARVMTKYPDILDGLSLEGVVTFKDKRDRPKHINPGVCGRAKLWVENNPQKTFTFVVVGILLGGCFFWRFWMYAGNCPEPKDTDPLNPSTSSIQCRNARKRHLIGWGLPIAKGCGQAMKATFTLILFPVSRNLMTNLRSTFLRYFFCFDHAVEFHRLLGKIGFGLAWVHAICHSVDVYRWSDMDNYDLWRKAFPNEQHQPPLRELLASPFGITGIMLLGIYTVAALFAFDYPKNLKIFEETVAERGKPKSAWRRGVLALGRFLNNFNYFWYTHHLFGVFYICMLLHPLPHIPNELEEWGWSDSWVWVFVPVVIYLTERVVRALRSDARDTTVLSAEILPGKVVGMRLSKPRGLVYTAGQYVFLNCPQLSRFEWHPFTLTSSPGDSFLGVHFRVAGDWTKALYTMVKTQCPKGAGEELSVGKGRQIGPEPEESRRSSVMVRSVSRGEELVQPSCPFQILVDGPFGAPAQNFKDYSVLLLVGAGIGVTPFASVLNDLLDTIQNHQCKRCGLVNLPASVRTRKVYFYWTVRSRNEALWFKHMLEAISMQDEDNLIDINIHVTSIRKANDVRVMLLRMAQRQEQEKLGFDPVANMRTRAITHFGRPNWTDVFNKLIEEHPDERYFGVFYCGPHGLSNVLRQACLKRTNKDRRFEYHQEVFG